MTVNDTMDFCEVSAEEASSSDENMVESLTVADKAKIEAILSSEVGTEDMRVMLEKLPESLTLVLLQTMRSLLAKKVNYTQTCLSWLQILLEVHEDMDVKCKAVLNEVRASLQSALTLQNPLNSLKGKLDVLIYQSDAALKDGEVEGPQETIEFSENSDEDTNNFIQTDNDAKVLGWDDFSDEEDEKSDEEMDQENTSEKSEEQEDASEESYSESD